MYNERTLDTLRGLAAPFRAQSTIESRYTFWVTARRDDGTNASPLPCKSMSIAEQARIAYTTLGYSDVHISIRSSASAAPVSK